MNNPIPLLILFISLIFNGGSVNSQIRIGDQEKPINLIKRGNSDSSDYVITGKQIKERFEKWLEKGEYEKTTDYEERVLNTGSEVFKSICFEEINNRDFKPEFRLKEYDVDNESFTIEFTLWNKKDRETQTWKKIELEVPIAEARNYKSRFTNLEKIYLGDNWVMVDQQFIPTLQTIKITINTNNQRFTFHTPARNSKPIIYSTENLGIKNSYLFPVIFDYDIYSGVQENGQSFSSSSTALPNYSEANDQVFYSVETDPVPSGGMTYFINWVNNNYKYPQIAIDAGVKGRLEVSFVVDRDGFLTDIKVLRDLGYGTGEAAVAVLEKAPRWKPGTKNGIPVSVRYSLPINLSLQ